jgi:hypothetical protein
VFTWIVEGAVAHWTLQHWHYGTTVLVHFHSQRFGSMVSPSRTDFRLNSELEKAEPSEKFCFGIDLFSHYRSQLVFLLQRPSAVLRVHCLFQFSLFSQAPNSFDGSQEYKQNVREILIVLEFHCFAIQTSKTHSKRTIFVYSVLPTNWPEVPTPRKCGQTLKWNGKHLKLSRT